MHPTTTRATRPASTGLAVAVVGTLLIAATYGMARFGVGLLAPRLVDERPALEPVVGWASGAQFLSYAVAATAAARLSDARPRAGLLMAGLTATLGCLGVAVASSPGWFVAAVFVGGMGAGFASPAMVRVVESVVPARLASTSHALVNTGTAFGVVGAGLLAYAVATAAPAWLVMAATNALAAGAVLLLTRGRSLTPTDGTDRGRLDIRPFRAAALAAVVVGAGSALIWTYGPLLATGEGPVDDGSVGALWIALGVGGLLGPLTGVVVDRYGPQRAWLGFAGSLALADLALAAGLGGNVAWATYAAMVLFGAGYMCLSGVLILWARELDPGSAGAGTSILFVALAVGQAVGAVAFQPLAAAVGGQVAALTAAVVCAAGAATTGRR